MTADRSRSLFARLLAASVLCGGLALAPTPVATRAADQTLLAAWRDADIAVDGSLADWTELSRVGQGPLVGARNDEHALYLVVASSDAIVRPQLATGLIVWIDRSGGKAQTFGLRLEGLTRRPLPGAAPDAASNGELEPGSRALDDCDVLGPARNQRRLVDRPADVGLALASGFENRLVIYEMKLPLAKSDAAPYAVDAEPGATIAIGLETPIDPKLPKRREPLDNATTANPWINDPYGGYFNPPPPTNSGSRPPKEKKIKPMKLVWATVRLASPR
jgi:hypothetical protein